MQHLQPPAPPPNPITHHFDPDSIVPLTPIQALPLELHPQASLHSVCLANLKSLKNLN